MELEVYQEHDRDTQLQIIDDDQASIIYDETLTTGLDDGRTVTIDTGSSELANEFETEYNWYADLEIQTNEIEYTQEESPEYSDSSNPWSFTTWDSPDEPSLVNPGPDGADNIEREPDLTVEVNQHDTADELEVDYYQDTGELLGSKTADVSDSNDQVTLTGDEYSDFAEDFNTVYSWYVEVTTPGGDDEETSSTWSFETVELGDAVVDFEQGAGDNLAYNLNNVDNGVQNFELEVIHEDDGQEMDIYFNQSSNVEEFYNETDGYISEDVIEFNAVDHWNNEFSDLEEDDSYSFIVDVRHPVDGQITQEEFVFTTFIVDVDWTPQDPNFDFFRVYQAPGNLEFNEENYQTVIESTPDTQITDANPDLSEGEHCYRVTALSLGGESSPAPTSAEGGDECTNVQQ